MDHVHIGEWDQLQMFGLRKETARAFDERVPRDLEATRNVFNIASRLSILRDFRGTCQVYCNFLHSDLSHDGTLFAMKEAYQIDGVC